MLNKALGINFGNKLEKELTNWAWLILRVSVAILMLRYGYAKLLKLMEPDLAFVDPIGLGPQLSLILVVGSEFLGSLLLLFGAFSRWASASLLFTMYVVAFIYHGPDPFSKKELAILYGIAFIFFALAGGGKYSVDHILKKKLK